MTILSRCLLSAAFSLCAVSACSNSYEKSVGQMANADEAGTSDCREPSPTIQYVSHDPVECQELTFECPPEGGEAFSDHCGCGCVVKQALDCPDPDDPAVHYIAESHDNPGICDVILFTCADDQTQFASPDCGCGCIDN